MARTAEEQRAKNAADQRRWRANAKAKKAAAAQKTPGVAASTAGTVAAPGAVDEPELVVDVKTEDTPKLSLKDRILAKLQDPTPAPKRPVARGKKQENLLATTLPTVVCSFVATYSQQLISDPYKPCAPSQQEVTGMLGPLMDILARQVEITGKASQTTIDIMNSVICTMMYGVRAYITYVEIKKLETPHYAEEKARKQAEYKSRLENEAREYDAVINDTGEPSLAGGLRAYQATSHGLNGDNSSVNAATTNGNAAETYDASSNADTADGAQEGEPTEAALVSNLFKRDIDGRIRLGLLSPRV